MTSSSVIGELAKLVDPKIKEILNLYVDRKTQGLVDYQIKAGGKRFRPILAVASCLACKGKIVFFSVKVQRNKEKHRT